MALTLPDDSILAIDEVVRVVPNKRMVCKGVWRNLHVYAKLFIGTQAKKYALRDKQGVQALINANIATPDLLYAGKVNGMEALIFKAIETAQNAEVLYQQLVESQQSNLADQKAARLNLLLKLTETVAQLHNANLQQTDLYFKNFLVDAETVYTIDGDGIQPLSPLCKQRQKRRNLATLFSKMDVLDSGWIQDCYTYYCKQTGAKYLAFDFADLYYLTQKIRQKTTSAYADKKVFRTCTDVKVTQNFKQYTASTSDFDATDLSVKQLDSSLDDAQNRLKSGNTCTVGKAFIADKNVVIKRYNIKNIGHGFKLSISQSRAAKSWANAHRLNILNIATAKPLLLLEARFGCFRQRTYFLAEYIDAPNIADFFATNSNKKVRAEAVKNIATLFYKLYLLKISHGDMKATNIKIADNKPVLIDLDSLLQHRFRSFALKAHARDLCRFMRNWQDTPALYNAFIKAFKVIYADNAPLKLAQIIE